MPTPSNVPQAPRKFKRIAHKPLSRGSLTRKPPFANVWPSGHVELGSTACDDLDALARKAGLDASAYSIGFGADVEANQISIYAEPQNSPGTSGFVRSTSTRRYSFSIASVFADSPDLRPITRRKCPVIATVDADNADCLVIALDSSNEFLVLPRKTKKQTTSTKPAKTENAQ